MAGQALQGRPVGLEAALPGLPPRPAAGIQQPTTVAIRDRITPGGWGQFLQGITDVDQNHLAGPYQPGQPARPGGGQPGEVAEDKDEAPGSGQRDQQLRRHTQVQEARRTAALPGVRT